MKFMYAANILVAGWISISSVFFPRYAASAIFQNAYGKTDIIRLVGCLWFAILILSVLGMWKPITFSPVFLVQLIYKSLWLVVVALPAIKNHTPFPSAMAIFFLVWVVLLLFVIPWSAWND